MHREKLYELNQGLQESRNDSQSAEVTNNYNVIFKLSILGHHSINYVTLL